LLDLKANLFGNKPNCGSYPGVDEIFYDPANVRIPGFLSDSPETRTELAQYYQSIARIDQGLGRLIEILKEAGAKTTVYDPGLRVPFVVRDPYQAKRGFQSEAMVSHVDITPTLLDFAGGLDHEINGPKGWTDPNKFWREEKLFARDNRGGNKKFRSYHGKSWLPALADPGVEHWDAIFASHTFHEIQMYYPMRVFQDKQYKLIWNIAHKLDYPFAADLWEASSWRAQFVKGEDAFYGKKTVGQYIHRAEFELNDLVSDPYEANNLAGDPKHAELLESYQKKMKAMQNELEVPWKIKWEYE